MKNIHKTIVIVSLISLFIVLLNILYFNNDSPGSLQTDGSTFGHSPSNDDHDPNLPIYSPPLPPFQMNSLDLVDLNRRQIWSDVCLNNIFFKDQSSTPFISEMSRIQTLNDLCERYFDEKTISNQDLSSYMESQTPPDSFKNSTPWYARSFSYDQIFYGQYIFSDLGNQLCSKYYDDDVDIFSLSEQTPPPSLSHEINFDAPISSSSFILNQCNSFFSSHIPPEVALFVPLFFKMLIKSAPLNQTIKQSINQ